MGWGAAQAFYEENSDWLDGVNDAYEYLYGEEKRVKTTHKCQICGKKLKTERGVADHMRDKHHKIPNRK